MPALRRIRRRWIPQCGCPACRQFSRAYLHHVVKAGEIIAAMLLTWHNLTFYQNLMADLRQAIAQDRLADFAARFTDGASRSPAAPDSANHCFDLRILS